MDEAVPRRTLIGRGVAGVGALIAVSGFALGEIAPRFIARDTRHVVTEAAVYVGLAMVVAGVILLSGRKV